MTSVACVNNDEQELCKHTVVRDMPYTKTYHQNEQISVCLQVCTTG